MPRVDEGSIVIEVGDILKLDIESLRTLVDWVLKSRALVVVEPTVSLVKLPDNPEAFYVTLGVGSVITQETPPVDIRYYTVVRPFWAKCLKVGLRNPDFNVAKGETVVVEGTVIALDLRDPVALIINGVRGEHVVTRGSTISGVPVARMGDDVVLYRVGVGYVTKLVEGEAARRVEYMATLVSSASGEVERDIDI